MARTGRFGRLPRAAPDLSGAIAALLREAQAKYDQNMVDAWKNGGQVDGKGVNDARLLAHFRKRRDALDPTDPLWTEWDNRVQQYEFSIEESKMSLKWDQKKATEADMRAFYTKWAKKATPNSEFQRHLQSQAAKWVTTAKGRASGGSKRSSASAHAKEVDDYYNRHVKAGEMANGYLVYLAKQFGAMPLNGNGLEDLNPNSAGYARFLDIYEDGKSNDPQIQFYIDDAEKRIRAETGDETWTFDKTHIDASIAASVAGTKHLIEISTTKTERKNWTDRRDDLTSGQNRIKDAPAIKAIFDAQETFGQRMQNCGGDPYCERNAMVSFRDALQKGTNTIRAEGISGAPQDITVPVEATIRYINKSLFGSEIGSEGGAVQTDRTVFDFWGEGPTGFIQAVGNATRDKIVAIAEGGWLSSSPVMDGNSPRRDSEGNLVFQLDVHGPGELPPTDAVLVEGSGALESVPGTTGPPAVVSYYVVPVPVRVQPVDATGAPMTGNVVPVQGRDEAGNPVAAPVAPNQSLYEELPGVIGPDGVARTVYRTGDGSKEKPYLYHSLEPTIVSNPMDVPAYPKGAAGESPRSLPGDPGSKVVPVRVTYIEDPEDPGTMVPVYDNTAFAATGAAQRVPLRSGLYPWGTYQTATGASAAAIIDDLWARDDPGAEKQANAAIKRFVAAAAATADPRQKAAIEADAYTLSKANDAYRTHTDGSFYNDFHDRPQGPIKDADTLRREAELRAAGITAARYGQDEVSRRVHLLGELEGWEESHPVISPTTQAILDGFAAVPGAPLPGTATGTGETGATAGGLRKSILDPTVGASQIKVPGSEGVLPGQAPKKNPIEQFLTNIAATFTTMGGEGRPVLGPGSENVPVGAPGLVTSTLLTENPFAGYRPADVAQDRKGVRGGQWSGVPTPAGRSGPTLLGPDSRGAAPGLGPRPGLGPTDVPSIPPPPEPPEPPEMPESMQNIPLPEVPKIKPPKYSRENMLPGTRI